MRKVYNGNKEPAFQRVRIPNAFPLYNQPHEIGLIVEGNQNVINADGVVVLDSYLGNLRIYLSESCYLLNNKALFR